MQGDPEYVCLEVTVPAKRCLGADMSISSIAFYNYMMEKQKKEYVDYRRIIKQYDDSAVALESYLPGMFHAPEVLIAEIGLDKSVPHIGVLMEKYDTSQYPKYELPKQFRFTYYEEGLEEAWDIIDRKIKEYEQSRKK